MRCQIKIFNDNEDDDNDDNHNKFQFVPVHAMKTYRGVELSCTHSYPGHTMEVGS